ncbi:MAG: T9SS type A sorting domain-containing protein [candidate division Zixibacteria bacterium]|nr:T9SS type A sorting domain-containing protein [candidate division Zixibacteria bacterium]
MLVDPENGNFNLMPNSPAIGSGRYGEDRGALPYQPTGVDDDPVGLPVDLALLTAYPNPFNSRVVIAFELAGQARVDIDIYNVLGQREADIFDGVMEGGKHSIGWNAEGKDSGVYFVRMRYGAESMTRKIVLVK